MYIVFCLKGYAVFQILRMSGDGEFKHSSFAALSDMLVVNFTKVLKMLSPFQMHVTRPATPHSRPPPPPVDSGYCGLDTPR